MSNKQYPDEFQIAAVSQVVEHGHNVTKSLAVTTRSLYAWTRKLTLIRLNMRQPNSFIDCSDNPTRFVLE